VIENQLSSAGFEWLEVGSCSVQGLRGSLIGCFQVRINLERLVVPIGLPEYKVGKESVAVTPAICPAPTRAKAAGDSGSPAREESHGVPPISGAAVPSFDRGLVAMGLKNQHFGIAGNGFRPVEGSKESSDHYVWTDVFVNCNGKWLAVASQTALIK
jgi:hypothetical protein